MEKHTRTRVGIDGSSVYTAFCHITSSPCAFSQEVSYFYELLQPPLLGGCWGFHIKLYTVVVLWVHIKRL